MDEGAEEGLGWEGRGGGGGEGDELGVESAALRGVSLERGEGEGEGGAYGGGGSGGGDGGGEELLGLEQWICHGAGETWRQDAE